MVVALPNLALYPLVSLGIMYVGVIFSGMNSRTITSEIKKKVKDSEAKLMVVNYISFNKLKNTGVPVIGIGNMESMLNTIS
jgi:4-coumarate--CoA ligase